MFVLVLVLILLLLYKYIGLYVYKHIAEAIKETSGPEERGRGHCLENG